MALMFLISFDVLLFIITIVKFPSSSLRFGGKTGILIWKSHSEIKVSNEKDVPSRAILKSAIFTFNFAVFMTTFDGC